MRISKAADIDAAVALGLLLVAAIGHLTAQPQFCCRSCCPHCAALEFYRTKAPHIADVAVDKALTEPVDWRMDADGQDIPAVNWPYLVQFWNTPDYHRCNPDTDQALINM